MFKKGSKIFAAVVILALVFSIALVTLTACDSDLQDRIKELEAQVGGYEADFSEKTITLYIGDDNEMSVTTRKAFLHDVLKDLKKDGTLTQYEFSGGELSPFVTKVGELKQDEANGKYYGVWHDVDEFSLKSVYSGYMPGRGKQKKEGSEQYPTVFVATELDGHTLYYSNVGVGLLPIVDGKTYAILVD